MHNAKLLLSLLFCLPMLLLSAQSQTIPASVQVTQAQKIGTIPPIRTLVPIQSTAIDRRNQLKMHRKGVVSNFAGRGKYVSTVENAQPQGPDPIRQLGVNRSPNNLPVEPLVNMDGLNSSATPSDPTGDIGADHYMQAVNATNIAIYDKEGNQLSTFTGNTLWSSLGFSSSGDPIILYDQEVGRWIITEFPSGNQLLFAISDDSDPMGGYTAYNFGTPNFPDYPKYSVWNNAYVVTTNEAGPANSPCYFIDREDILSGADNPDIQRLTLPGASNGPGFQVDTPVDWSGMTPPPVGAQPMILSLMDDAWGETAQDQLDIYFFNVDFENAANTGYTVQNLITSAFDTNPCSAFGPGFACIPQQGGSGLDGIPETVMHQAHYRNFGSHEVMVLNFITDVSGGNNLSGIRWMELRRSVGDTDWTIYQEGTFAPDDGLDRFMGGIAIDGNGNIGLAYNVSSEDIFVGVRFTGRRAGDPLGEMTVPEYTVADGQGTIQSGGRFGDYAHMSVDPANNRTFWYTTEYAGATGTSSARTRILAFELRKDTTDIGPTALASPQSAALLTATEQVTAQFRNFGLDTQSVFTVGYVFENGAAVTEEVNSTLYPDSIYEHTFASTVDMSTIGNYNFTIFSSLAADQALLNDTLRAVVSHLPRYDLGVMAINGLPQFTCEESIEMEAVVSNFGTETITSATILLSVNGTVQEFPWTGELVAGGSVVFPLSLTGFLDGDNTIIVSTSAPNGETDENMANDGRTETLAFVANGELVSLNLLTDNFPGETSWNLMDQEGNVLFSGGPYNQGATLITETWCLPLDGCFVFEILDSFGDGIGGNGNYSITNADGAVLASGNGNFGFSETKEFCAEFMCLLDASINFNPEVGNGNNGAIFITASNGTTPYTYSIDGGATMQSGNLFGGLTAGEYFIEITDANDCVVYDTVNLYSCVMDLMGEVQDASGASTMDGSINVVVNGGTAPYQYSIDDGETFQADSLFENLAPGEYEVEVVDANGCEVDTDMTVGILTSTNNFHNGHIIEVFPNPNDGAFQLKVTGLSRTDVFLPLQVISADGKLLHEYYITRYDGHYVGMVSLMAYPSGMYYVRLVDDEVERLLKIVKR